MVLEIIVAGKPMIIDTDAIDRDIAMLESAGKIGRYVDGVYESPRPDMHGMLTCLRDLRKYDPDQIATMCLGMCPHPVMNNPVADDSCHLDDCWQHIFNALSMDQKTVYVRYDLSQ